MKSEPSDEMLVCLEDSRKRSKAQERVSAPADSGEDLKSKTRKRSKRFNCAQCKHGKAFINQKRLDRHVATIHNSSKRVTCQVCNVELKSALFHKRHILAKHPETPRLYTCDYDGRSFELKDYLRVHLDRHRKHQMYTCEICQKAYVSRHTFRRHLKMHIEKHVCNECGQTFGNKINLDSHVASKHTEEQTVPCNYCTRLFSSKAARNNHQYMSHKNKDELNFKCPICNIYFEMKEELRIHSFIHWDGEIKPCPECDQIFKTTRLLNVHMHKHQTNKSFQCSDCGDFFTFKTGLAKHHRLNRCKGPADELSVLNRNSDANQDHVRTLEDVARTQLASITRSRKTKKAVVNKSGPIKKPIPAEADESAKSQKLPEIKRELAEIDLEVKQEVEHEAIQFLVDDGLKETRKVRKQTFVVNSRPGRAHLTYSCDLCGEEVKYIKNITKHMKTHVSQDMFQCKMCSKGDFRSRKSLSDHLLAIHAIKTSVLLEIYTCKVCGMKFDTKSRFEGHKLSHDESARTFNCSTCSAAFKTIGNLRRHEATHAKSRDFHCDKCSKSFKTKIALNVHNQNVHSQFKVVVKCPICNTFVKEKNLNHHTKNQHSEDSNLKLFGCTICQKTFKTQKLGERHYEAVHNPKDKGVVYSCPQCPEKFFRLRNLKDHSFVHFSGPIFQCETCQKMFKSSRLLRIHIQAIHDNADTTLACGHCDAVLKTRSGLVKHVKSRHPELRGKIEFIKVDLNAQM